MHDPRSPAPPPQKRKVSINARAFKHTHSGTKIIYIAFCTDSFKWGGVSYSEKEHCPVPSDQAGVEREIYTAN
jgi:hypothetical protein